MFKPLGNQNGSVIVIAMIMLVLLTLIGISSTTTSTTEVQIATNNQAYQIEFYLADSGWRQGAIWLENLASPPNWVNSDSTDNTVKNFGSGTVSDAETSDFSNLTPDNSTLSHYALPYWYRVSNLDPGLIPGAVGGMQGNEKGFERFYFGITSNANSSQQIDTRVSKIYKVGY
jgi:Tfp pilus assembly protein PilX